MYTFLIAVFLLTSPPDTLIDIEPTEEIRQAIAAIAQEWEILDPRELRYVLCRPEDFEADLRLLRTRHYNLSDAPWINDGLRFPDRATINDYLAFNRSYRQNIEAQGDNDWMYKREKYRQIINETDNLYHIWDCVRDAQCEYYYVTVRRLALKKLREQVGYEAYNSGTLPPYVPLWRFREIP